MSPELQNATLAACALFYPGFAKFSRYRREACVSIVGKVIASTASIARRDAIDACARIAEANAMENGATISGLIRALHASTQLGGPASST